MYWYHPHIREDYGQELGLYGNILVQPTEPDYWPPAHREDLLTLDDILLEDGQVAAFSRSETTHVAMGRFGHTMLIGGQTTAELEARLGEVVRFYLTNTANTRVFNVSFVGARMKLVGGDSGRYEHEELVAEVLLAPSERTVVDVLFDTPGEVPLVHRHPNRAYQLATVRVGEDRAEPPLDQRFARLRTNPDMAAERERLAPFLDSAPDKTLAFVAEMDMGTPEGAVVYACPMHFDVVSAEQGHCPQCGMKLIAVAPTYACTMHPDVVSESPDTCPRCGMTLLLSLPRGDAPGDGPADAHTHHHHEPPSVAAGDPSDRHEHAGAAGIEWEDDMVDVNRATTPATMRSSCSTSPTPACGWRTATSPSTTRAG